MSVDNVDLLKNIVDIPHLDASVDTRRDNAVPVADGQRFELNDPREMCVQYLYQLGSLERPNVQIFSVRSNLTSVALVF